MPRRSSLLPRTRAFKWRLLGCAALLVVTLAAGCGQKGPLYLPAKQKTTVPAGAPSAPQASASLPPAAQAPAAPPAPQ